MRFAALLAALPPLCVALGAAAFADDGAPGRGHTLAADLARLAPSAAVPPAHPGQDLGPVEDAATGCAADEGCTPAEVALDR